MCMILPCPALRCYAIPCLHSSTLLYIAPYSLLCPALPCPALPCPALPCPALHGLCDMPQCCMPWQAVCFKARSLLLQMPPNHLSLLIPFAVQANMAAASIAHPWPHISHARHSRHTVICFSLQQWAWHVVRVSTLYYIHSSSCML